MAEPLAPKLAERLLLGYARYFPLRRGKLLVVNAMWRQAAEAGSTQRIAQLRYGRMRMHVDIAEQLQRQFYFFGTYLVEESILTCWKELARDAQIILDVGANRGIYSIAALAASPTTTVHAFEPTPEIAASLRHTAEINGLTGLHVHELAVLDRSGDVRLVEYGGSDGQNGGMNYVISDERTTREQTFGVSATRLDEFCSRYGIARIDLLKVDVQGHEPAVLSGAGALLQERLIQNIFLELNWSADGTVDCPARSVVNSLAKAGYQFANPKLPLRLREAGDWLQQLTDVIAVNPSIGG